jgi:hypothetical protein
VNFYQHINENNRAAIDVFFAARVARQKGLRLSAFVRVGLAVNKRASLRLRLKKIEML